jgi:hypothetical protein
LNQWAEAAAARRGLDPALVLPHAHGMWVHAAATQGLIGVAVWSVVVGVALVCGAAADGRHAPPRVEIQPEIPDFWSQISDAYSLAPGSALVGLILAGLFDTIHVNSQTAMLLFALIALCAMGRDRSA